jgi:uncharacterized protein (DUF1684 family)
MTYTQDIQKWRAERETKLRADDGWLTLCGLFWLKEGKNTVGSDGACDIVLPDVPGHLGVIDFRAGAATLRVTCDTTVTVDGKPVHEANLQTDADHATPSYVTCNAVTFWVIKRGTQYGIRARDKNSNVLKDFQGCTWFEPKPELRIKAKFAAHHPPRELPVINILGIAEPTENPGTVDFELDGRAYSFETFEGGKDNLFIVFRDATAGDTTYGASRFLMAPLAADGSVDLDFNKSFNPPCAFTMFAVCPLPLKQNILPIKIEAGETYHGTH